MRCGPVHVDPSHEVALEHEMARFSLRPGGFYLLPCFGQYQGVIGVGIQDTASILTVVEEEGRSEGEA